MKRFSTLIVAALAATVLAFSCLALTGCGQGSSSPSSPSKVSVPIINEEIFKATQPTGGSTLFTEEYDFTGDDKADALVLEIAEKEKYGLGSLTVSLNDTYKETFEGLGNYNLKSTATVLRTTNGRMYLYITVTSNNGDGQYIVLEWINDKFQEVCSNDLIKVAAHHHISSVTPEDDSLKVTFSPMNCTVGAGFTCTFTYKWDGTATIRTSDTADSFVVHPMMMREPDSDSPWITVDRVFTCYEDSACTKSAFNSKKGAKMRVTNVELRNGRYLSFEVEDESGNKGWIEDPLTLPYVKNSNGTLFKECGMAG